jgi:hypothetical protein
MSNINDNMTNNHINNNIKKFSLNKFRKIKDNFYSSKEECLKKASLWGSKYGDKYITNPRFKGYDQTYFHAGDFKDLNKYALLPLRYLYSLPNLLLKNKLKSKKLKSMIDNPTKKKQKIIKLVKTQITKLENKKVNKKVNTKIKNSIAEIKLKNNSIIEPIYKLYKDIDYISVYNSLNYMFTKFKKGIFVIIRNNKLIVYLPFSNADYVNNWYKQTYFSEEDRRLLQTGDYKNPEFKRKLDTSIFKFQNAHPDQFKHRKINLKREKWYSNNCIFRNQFPEYEGELNTNVYRNMLEELLKERIIPDIEFFINDRDFPILKKDLTEPYDHLFDSDSIKIEDEFQVKKMAPIFSKSVTADFADILIPTNDEWTMMSNHYFTDSCSDSYHKEAWSKINLDWSKKRDVCIFRGSATGCGNTIENNMRLKAADMSIDFPDLLDAGITNWKARMKKYKGESINIIDTSKFRFKLANMINDVEKSGYKYILNIDGYVSAFRLASELSMGSVVFIVESPYKMWFSKMLKSGIHYISIKHDLSDLIEKIKWCRSNDKECEKISRNALIFHKKYLTRDGIFNYLANTFAMIYQNRNLKNPLQIKQLKVKKHIAIISCFRDKGDGERERERKLFISLMNRLLEPYYTFHIYIIEQSQDGNEFNIGKLKNIGFELANKLSNKKFDSYIFTDIDLIPDYNLMQYLGKKVNFPISLAARGTRYESFNTRINQIFLGGMLQFSKEIFEKINGYANNFWGWGGEDQDFLTRLSINKIYTVGYPKTGIVIDNEENEKMVSINNFHQKKPDLKIDEFKYEKLFTSIKYWSKNGLSELNYDILKTSEINKTTTQILVDLLKKKDIEKYPYLFPGSNPNYSEMKMSLRDIWKNIKIKYI